MSSTASQIAANIENAQHSTGPRTEAGKSVSSQNGITLGLFTASDFIRPGEEPAYAELTAQLNAELSPKGILETTLADEIRRATWRLRRCAEAEANLVLTTQDPMEFPGSEADKIQRSVDRARAQSHRLFHKCTAELRRLQTDRKYREETFASEADTADHGLADWQQIRKGLNQKCRADFYREKNEGMAHLEALMSVNPFPPAKSASLCNSAVGLA